MDNLADVVTTEKSMKSKLGLSPRGKPMLNYDGSFYGLKKVETDGTHVWKCVNKDCPGKLLVRNDNYFLQEEHWLGELGSIKNEIQQVMFDLKLRSLQNLDEPPKDVVKAVLDAVQPSPTALENMPNEASLKRSVYSWRKRAKDQNGGSSSSNPTTKESPRRRVLKVKIKGKSGKSNFPEVNDMLTTPKDTTSLPTLSPLARDLPVTPSTPNTSKPRRDKSKPPKKKVKLALFDQTVEDENNLAEEETEP